MRHGFEFACHKYENNFGPKVHKTAPRTLAIMRPRMAPPGGLRRCPILFRGSSFCINVSISFLCEANIFFSLGFKVTCPRAALTAWSEIDLITLSGIFALIAEIISGWVQVARYLIVHLRLGFLFLGAICHPFYIETAEYNRISSPAIYWSWLYFALAFRGEDLSVDMSVLLVLGVGRLVLET